jgi:hypothetical protein
MKRSKGGQIKGIKRIREDWRQWERRSLKGARLRTFCFLKKQLKLQIQQAFEKRGFRQLEFPMGETGLNRKVPCASREKK